MMIAPQTRKLNKKIDRLKYLEKALPKARGIGSSLRLQNTIEYPFYKLILGGNTKQDSYKGYNLLKYPYSNTTKTQNGITFTDNQDGSISVNGTATNDTYFYFCYNDKNLDIIEDERYTLQSFGLNTGITIDTYNSNWGGFLGNYILSKSSTHTSNIATSNDIKPILRIKISNGATVNDTIKLLLYKGDYDSSKQYEKYVRTDKQVQI